ncbi:MAG: CDP-alcohol phosphatidyltransferase family protein [Steroidobacteraceae bacterium]
MSSTTWTHLLARPVMRPLIGTAVRPNHITTLRLLTGIAACVAFAWGNRAGMVWGGGLWLVSAFLDRADGELARLANMMSPQGHRYDYLADVWVNTLFFIGIGIGLRHSVLGRWSMPLGLLSGASTFLASVFAEMLELRGPPGTKAVSGRWGFDPDDALYLMGPLAWLGWLTPILVAASVGATTAMVIVGMRLRRTPIPQN